MSFDVNWDIDKYKEEHESEDHWILRRNFLERWKESYPEERLVCLARVFANMEFMGCKYPLPVMQEVARMSKEVNIDITCSSKIANTPSYRYFGGNEDSLNAKKRPASISRQLNLVSKKAKLYYNDLSSSDDQNFTIHTHSSDTAGISEPANTLKHMDMSSNNISCRNFCFTSPKPQNSSLVTKISDESLDPSYVYIDNKNSGVSILISDDENSNGIEFIDTFVKENETECMSDQSRYMRMWYTKYWIGDKQKDRNESPHTVKHSVLNLDRSYETIGRSINEDPTVMASMGIEDQVYYTIIGSETCTIPLAKYYWRQLKDQGINKAMLKNQYSSFWKMQSEGCEEKMEIDRVNNSICGNDWYIWAKYFSKVPTDEIDTYVNCDSDHDVKQTPSATHKMKNKSKKIKTQKLNIHQLRDPTAALMEFINQQSKRLPAKYWNKGVSKKKQKIISSWMKEGATKYEAQILCYYFYKNKTCMSHDQIVKLLKLRRLQSPYVSTMNSDYEMNTVVTYCQSPTQAQELSSQIYEQPEKSSTPTRDRETLEQEIIQQKENISIQIIDVHNEPNVKSLYQVPKLADISLRFVIEQIEKSYHQISKPSVKPVPEWRLKNLANESSSLTPGQTLNTGSQNLQHIEQEKTAQSLCQVPRLTDKPMIQILDTQEKLQCLKLPDISKSDVVVQTKLNQEQNMKSVNQVEKLVDIALRVLSKQADELRLYIPEQSKSIDKSSSSVPEPKLESNTQIAVTNEQKDILRLQQNKKRMRKVSLDSLHHTPAKSTKLHDSTTMHAHCTDTVVISDDDDDNEVVTTFQTDTQHLDMMNKIKERQDLRYHKSKGESQSITSKSRKIQDRKGFVSQNINLERSKAELKYNQLRACIRDVNKIIRSKHTKILQDAIEQSINDDRVHFLRFLAKNDCLVIICADKIARDWLDKLIPTLQPWPRANLVIVKDLPPPVRAEAFIPFVSDFFDNHLQPYDLLDKLHEQNLYIGCDKWEVFKSKKARDGQCLTFLFDYQTDVALQAQQYMLTWASKPIRIELVSIKPIHLKESVSPAIIDLCIDDTTTSIACNNEPIQITHSENIPIGTESTSSNILKTDDDYDYVRIHETIIAPMGTSQSLVLPDNCASSYLVSSQAVVLSEPTNSLPIEQVAPSSLKAGTSAQEACSKDIFDKNIETEDLLLRFASNYYNNLDVNLQLPRKGTRSLFWTKLGATKLEAQVMTQITFKSPAEHNEMVKRMQKLAKKRAKIIRQTNAIARETMLHAPGQDSAAAKRARLKLYIKKDRDLRQLRVSIKDTEKKVRPEDLSTLQLLLQQCTHNTTIHFPRFATQDDCLIVICADIDSRNWLEQHISSFKPWPGANLTIVDSQCPLTARVFIPDFPIRNLQPYALLDTLHKENPDVGCDRWEFVRSQLIRGGVGVRLTFKFDYKSNDVLLTKKYHLNFMSKKILIKLKKKDKIHVRGMANNKGKNVVDDSTESSSDDESPENPSKSTIEKTEMKAENTLIPHKDEEIYAFSNEMAKKPVTGPESYTKHNDAPSRPLIRDFPEPCIPAREVKPTAVIDLTESTHYLPLGQTKYTSVDEHQEMAQASPYMTTQLGNQKEEALDNATESEQYKHNIANDAKVYGDEEHSTQHHRNPTVIRPDNMITNVIKSDNSLNVKEDTTQYTYHPRKNQAIIKEATKSPWFGHLLEEHKVAVGLEDYPLENKFKGESHNHQATDRTETKELTRYVTSETNNYLSTMNRSNDMNENYNYTANNTVNLQENYCEPKYDHASVCPPQRDIIDIIEVDSPVTISGNANAYSRERDFPHPRKESKDRTDYDGERFSFQEVRNSVDKEHMQRDPVNRRDIDLKCSDTGYTPRSDSERANTFVNDRPDTNRGYYTSNERDVERESEGFDPNARQEFSQTIYKEEITFSRQQSDDPQTRLLNALRTESSQFVEGRNVYQMSMSRQSSSFRGSSNNRRSPRGGYHNQNVYQRTVDSSSGPQRNATNYGREDQSSSYRGRNSRRGSRDQYRNN